jgi:site-specific DNA recombinase
MALAIYIRVSTDAQVESGTSLGTQIDACRKKAQDLGYDLSKEIIYSDEGESGADIDRPALNALRGDIELGIINNAVICFDPDRLSRKLHYQLILEEEFKSSNIPLIFVNSENKRETPEGMLLFHMQGAVAEYERTKIKERTIRGKLAKARQGQIMPMRNTPYGYNWEDGKLKINNNEIKIVKNVFQWYISGLTMKNIGQKLIDMGFQARLGQWNASTIRNILKNETYVGRFWYNRRKHERLSTKTESGNHAIKEKQRPKSDHILIEVPAIIDEITWQKAQAQKTKNTIYSKRNTKLKYMARGGYLRCADCGRVLQNTSYTVGHGEKSYSVGVYRCPNLNPRSYKTEKCPSSNIKAKLLDNFIWEDLITMWINPQRLELFDNTLSNKNNIDFEKERKHLEVLQSKIKIEKDKILSLYRKELITLEDVESQLESIKRREHFISNQWESLIQQEKDSRKQTMTKEEKQEIFNILDPFLLTQENFTLEDKQFILHNLVDIITVKLRKGIVELTYKGVFNVMLKHEYKPNTKTQIGSLWSRSLAFKLRKFKEQYELNNELFFNRG